MGLAFATGVEAGNASLANSVNVNRYIYLCWMLHGRTRTSIFLHVFGVGVEFGTWR